MKKIIDVIESEEEFSWILSRRSEDDKYGKIMTDLKSLGFNMIPASHGFDFHKKGLIVHIPLLEDVSDFWVTFKGESLNEDRIHNKQDLQTLLKFLP